MRRKFVESGGAASKRQLVKRAAAQVADQDNDEAQEEQDEESDVGNKPNMPDTLKDA